MQLKHVSIALFLCLILAVGVFAADRNDIQAKVYLNEKSDVHQLRALHMDVVYPGMDYFEIITNPDELAKLEALGFKTEIVHESVSGFYRSRLDTSKDMGGYATLSEIEAWTDSMIAAHSSILSSKISIGQTIEGREMWAFKISDNPNVDEDEPEVMFTAAIHAREVITPLVIEHFVEHMADNYGINPDVTDIVDNREIWIVPCVNPDGYYHNEYTDPGGGGMWRKNRRNNGNGTYGVDLNRNYGYEWGYDDGGSSPDPSDETYRGTGPFSEPETQNLRDWAIERNFAVTLYFHSASNLILWPWGYDSYFTPDEDIFSAMGDSMAVFNSYDPGPIWILYEANGGTDDWHYGEQTLKDKSFAFTIEVGDRFADGFWPATSRIPALVAENLGVQMYLARQAGNPYALKAPLAPSISLAPVVNGLEYLVEWTHTDSLNPAVAYELVEMQGPGMTTDPADDLNDWDNDGFTVSTSRSYSAPSSFYSGQGNNLNNTISTTEPFAIALADTLRFWTYYDIEVDWDYAYVEASTDGTTFEKLAGNITTTSNPHGTNLGNGITGSSGGWVEAIFDLTGYTETESLLIRFAYVTDGSQVEEGFYIDDIYPHYGFGISTVVDSDIADDFWTFTDKPAGDYYYKVRAKDAEEQWGPFSEITPTLVTAGNRGDVDLDGVAYSIGDLALLNLYFAQGLPAFDAAHMEAQIEQSDANCDGLTLSSADADQIADVLLGLASPCSYEEKGYDSDGVLTMRDDPLYGVAIQNTTVNFSDTAYVDIVLTDGNADLLGFQFHLEYDNTKLSLADVELGVDLPNWDLVSYNDVEAGAVNQVRLLGVAWTEGDPVDSSDISPQPTPKQLARLKFAILDSEDDFTTDLRFVWQNCYDNTIAVGAMPGPSQEMLALSRVVYDADLTDITGTDPLYGGTAGHCDNGYAGGTGLASPMGSIDFTSGRVGYVASCCVGNVGNVDCGVDDQVTMADLTVLIDHLFISLDPLCCLPEADLDHTFDVTMSDLTVLIDHLFISLDPLGPCQ